MNEKTVTSIVKFSKLVGRLKKEKRRGWVTQFGMEHPETVADHSFRAAVLAMLIADLKGLDTEKIIRMALLHDLHESLMGDWDVEAKKKFGKDKEAEEINKSVKKVLDTLPNSIRGQYSKLWEEMLECKTAEAVLIKDIDRVECSFQILEYEKEGYDRKKLREFLDYDKERISDHDIKKVFKALEEEFEAKPGKRSGKKPE